VRKMAGVGPDQAPNSPVGSGTSLLWLANHMADAEVTWVLHRFARRNDDGSAGPPAARLDEAVARYRRVWPPVDAVITNASSLDEPCPPFDDRPVVNLRWIATHLLEETARHAGHADILRELSDGATGR
jgi:Protein of unknown function (DUF664)